MTPASPVRSTELVAGSCEGLSRLRVGVAGIVQGVGFRPFVHRIAHELQLAGCVRNTFDGAELEIEGPRATLEALLAALRDRCPPMARIDRLQVEEVPALGEKVFRILHSASVGQHAALISPDASACPDCMRELRDPSDRRHRYPFINCTNCGPRFTIVQEVPYDRPKTTMSRFAMCPSCQREYGDPADRRYHAQPVACPDCGPSVQLLGAGGERMAERGEAIARARQMLLEGGIVAIKGAGGFQLACDASNSAAVSELRKRKARPRKPLAIMCRDREVVQALCEPTTSELEELEQPTRAILLLRRRREVQPPWAPVAIEVAPGHDDLGVMLPSTPLHELLLESGGAACLVMTSGNRSGEPIEVTNQGALQRLAGIADAFVVHDREIWNRCDDSVGAMSGDRLMLMRRARGFVPLPVELPLEVQPTLALGAMFANAFAIGAGRRVFLSQHIGDVDSLQTLEFLNEAQKKLRRWLGLDPALLVRDLHPDLLTTRLAAELANGRRVVAVQHHHAHLASAMAAAGIDEPVQGIVFDGTGYGIDGKIWGGELLVGTAASVRRAGHLREMPLPGGDASTRRTLRIAMAWMHVLMPEGAPELELWQRAGRQEAEVVCRMVDRGFNTPMTTSVGRMFDAVSSLLGVCDASTYEGQGAIELEQFARGARDRAGLRMAVCDEDGVMVIDPEPAWRAMVEAIGAGAERRGLAWAFHQALAEATAEACARVAHAGGPRKAVFCGGVFQNRILVELASQALTRQGLEAVLPGAIPVNDGGLALGQVLVANAAPEPRSLGAPAGWENA